MHWNSDPLACRHISGLSTVRLSLTPMPMTPADMDPWRVAWADAAERRAGREAGRRRAAQKRRVRVARAVEAAEDAQDDAEELRQLAVQVVTSRFLNKF